MNRRWFLGGIGGAVGLATLPALAADTVDRDEAQWRTIRTA